MLKISKKLGYTLMSLKYMLENNKNLKSTREISDELEVPFDTLAKIMQSLNKYQIVTSVQGVTGGYQVTEKLESISMAELSNIIEKNGTNSCKDCTDCDRKEKCNVQMPIHQFNRIMMKTLENIKVKELLVSDINLEVTDE